MSEDIKITQNSNDGVFDFGIVDGDIEGDDGFDTAIFDSLLEEARAPEEKVSLPENRRGWIGNIASTVKGRERGSLLWLTEQRRLTQNTLNETVDYPRKALNWFVEDSIASDISVTGVIVPTLGIRLTIIITLVTGEIITKYINMWELTGNAD